MFRLGVGLTAIVFAPVAVLGAQSGSATRDVAALLARVGESVQQYYARAQSLICLETVSLQSLSRDLLADQTLARRLTYDLRISWEPAPDGGTPEATVQRQLLKVGNRPPTPKDKPGCLDPKEVSPEPLAMLLPVNQVDYVFTYAGNGRVDGRQAVMLDYKSRAPGPITSKDAGEDCWSIELPGRQRGRVWIDVETNDVLRLDEGLTGIFEVTLPATKTRRDRVRMTIERLDTSTLYRAVKFTDPDEVIMLPRSVQTLTIVNNSGSPRVRKTQTFSNYRRFLTEGRIVEEN